MLRSQEDLRRLFTQNNRETWARVTSLTIDELPKETIEGKITGGNISLDGKSACRRSCNLTITSGLDINIEDQILWGLNTKIKLEIGILDRTTDKIEWFKMGLYIISSLSFSKSTTGYTINLQGKDKMCLINGDVGGNIYAAVDFGTEDIIDKLTGEQDRRDYPIEHIIREGMREYANEPYQNIIIEDIPDYGQYLLEWRGSNSLFIYVKANSQEGVNCVLDQTVWWSNNPAGPWTGPVRLRELEGESSITFMDLNYFTRTEDETHYTYFKQSENSELKYNILRIKSGQTAGYQVTDLTYPRGDKEESALTVGVGGTFTDILNKIVAFLGNYEYFYNVDGQFVFRKKQKDIGKDWSSIEFNDTGLGNTYDMLAAEPTWDFKEEEQVTSFSDSPNLNNVKNDFSIWGTRKGLNDSEVPIHLRYAIHEKPFYYKSLAVSKTDIWNYVKQHPEFKNSFDKSDPNWEFDESNPENNKYEDIISHVYFDKNSFPYQDFMDFDSDETNWVDSPTAADDASTPGKIPDPDDTDGVYWYPVDWREIIYQMAKDYMRFKHFDDFYVRVMENNFLKFDTPDGVPGIQLQVNGITSYEPWYVDMEAFWRQLYSPRKYYVDEAAVGQKAATTDPEENTYTDGKEMWVRDDWYKLHKPDGGTYDGYVSYRLDTSTTPSSHVVIPFNKNIGGMDEYFLLKDTDTNNTKMPILLSNPHSISLEAYCGIEPALKRTTNVTPQGETHLLVDHGNYTNLSWIKDNKAWEPVFYMQNMTDFYLGSGGTKPTFNSSTSKGIVTSNTTLGTGIYYDNSSADNTLEVLNYQKGEETLVANLELNTKTDSLPFCAFRNNKYNLILPVLKRTWAHLKPFYTRSESDDKVAFIDGMDTDVYNFYTIYLTDYPLWVDYEGGKAYKKGEFVKYNNIYYKCKQSYPDSETHVPGGSGSDDYWTPLESEPTQKRYFMFDSVNILDSEGNVVKTKSSQLRRVTDPSTAGIKWYDTKSWVYRMGLIRSGRLSDGYQIQNFGEGSDKTSFIITRVGAISSAAGKDLYRLIYGTDNTYITTYSTSTADFGDNLFRGLDPTRYSENWIKCDGSHFYNIINSQRFFISGNAYDNMVYLKQFGKKIYYFYDNGIYTNPLIANDSSITTYTDLTQDKLNPYYYFLKMDASTGTVEVDDHDPPNYKYKRQAIEYWQRAEFFQDSSSEETGEDSWNTKVQEAPESLVFWIDFLDSRDSTMGKYGVNNVMYRPKAETDEKATAIYYRDTINVFYDMPLPADSYEAEIQKQKLAQIKEAENPIFKADTTVAAALSTSSKAHSCKDVLDQQLYNYTQANETVNISAIPIYHLQPNDIIALQGEKQVINTISFPLTYNGTMNIQATKWISSLQGGGFR